MAARVKMPLLTAFQMHDHFFAGLVGVASDDQFYDAGVFIKAVLQARGIKLCGPEDDLMNTLARLLHEASQVRVRNELAQQKMKRRIEFDAVSHILGSKALFCSAKLARSRLIWSRICFPANLETPLSVGRSQHP